MDPFPDDEQQRAAQGNGQAGTDERETSPRPSPVPRLAGPVYSPRLKLLILATAIVAIFAMSWTYLRTVDNDSDVSATGSGATAGVESLHPAENSQVLQQQSIAVDLSPGWDGTLTVNGTEIPEADLTRSTARRQAAEQSQEARLEFVPGPGKVLESLEPGQTCVNARLWHRSSDQNPRTVNWCFTVI